MKRILTIGAYERDNFGDLLFFLLLKEVFNKDYVVPSSIIFSDMTEILGEIVYPYNTLLKEFEWDIIIVVGGEIGGVDIHSALNMSLSDKEYQILEETGENIDNCYDYLTGFKSNRTAYLPDLDEYSKNTNSFLVINSIGLSSLKSMNGTIIYNEFNRILKKAKFLSVRDNSSFEYLNSLNIENKLCPDIVHIIKKVMDKKVNNQLLLQNIDDDYILFQCNMNYIQSNTLNSIVDNIQKLIVKYNKKIYLFAAGIARNHDSIELYEQIICKIDEVFKTKVIIIYERNPLCLVKYIKYSKMWIGTSLHGRIIAITYAIPRISLENKKVAQYASLWDKELPYDVSLNQLINSCEIAFSFHSSALNAISISLENEAYRNLNNYIEVLNEK